MIGFKFDTLAHSVNKPLLLMVGELDQYPEVHFLSNVKSLAATLGGLGKALTVQDTGHSIHNALWASNTVQDFSSPTFVYTDANGYSYDETS